MKTNRQLWWIAALLLIGADCALAERFGGLKVAIVDDRGQPFAQYPLKGRSTEGPGVFRAYVEARNGRPYGVRVQNETGERIGLVIAVDGRNIISGRRSNLAPGEKMYILEPGQRATYEGWRTGRDRVNRFYFTEAGDSYAGAFGDYSAMGVIAVAGYREDQPIRPWWRPGADDDGARAQPSTPSATESARAGAAPSLQAEPGTGYGERQWSPSRQVAFAPEREPFERRFLKYAWRATLCRQGIIDCGDPEGPPRHNRFWDPDPDYAPPPPR